VRINKIIDSKANVLAKLESRNPLASVKDRIGLSIIDTALKDGSLRQDGIVIEAILIKTQVLPSLINFYR
jgi:cysteine synthase